MPLSGSLDYKSWKYKCYIQDDYENWVDFSADADSLEGADALLNCDGFKYEYENDLLDSVFTTSLTSVVLDNTDNWLDGCDFGPKYPDGISLPIGSNRTKGAAVLFDSTSDRITIPITSGIDPFAMDNFTLSAWINPTATTLATQSMIINKQYGSNGYRLVYQYSATTCNIVFEFWVKENSSSYSTIATVATVPFVGNWHHVGATLETCDEPDFKFTKVNVIIDGVIAATNTFNNVTIKHAGNVYLNIGEYAWADGYNFYGKIDEVRIYNAVMPQSHFQYLYNGGIGRFGEKHNNLLGAWRLDENTGTTAKDYSGNNRDGVLSGTPTWTTGIVPNDTTNGQFKLSKGKITKAWKGRKVKISIQSIREDGSYDIDDLGVFFIKSTKNVKNTKVLNLESISQKLSERSADTVSDGGSWYENASYSFIIEKLLKTELAETNSTNLPGTFIIPKLIEKPTLDTVRQRNGYISTNIDTRVLSTLGRPAEFQGTADQGNFLNSGGVCTAMYLWKYNVGSVTRSSTPTELVGYSTDWVAPNVLRPAVGDCLTLDDARHGNSGFYEISKITDDTHITLKTPLKGRLAKFYQMNYSVVRIYMAISYFGCKHDSSGNSIICEIWKYIPGLDKYVKLMTISDDMTGLKSGGIYRIGTQRKSPYGEEDKEIVCIGFDDILNFSHGTVILDKRTNYGYKYTFNIEYGEIFELNVASLTIVSGTNSYLPQTGFHHFRLGEGDTTDPEHYYAYTQRIGLHGSWDFRHVIGGEYIAVPFEQYVGEINRDIPYIPSPDEIWQVGPNSIKKYPNWIYGSSGVNVATEDGGNHSRDVWNELFTEEQTQAGDGTYKSIPGSSAQYSTPFKVSSGFHSAYLPGRSILIWYPADEDWRKDRDETYTPKNYIFKYSSNQKGAFAILPGVATSDNPLVQAGGVFYYIYNANSFAIGDMEARSRLVTPTWTGANPNVTDTLYFFSCGIRIGPYAHYNSKNLHPTYIEPIDGKSEFIISFVRFDDAVSGNQTYPWKTYCRTYVYRCLWERRDSDITRDFQTSFLSTSPTTLTVAWDSTSGDSMTVATTANIRDGDILRVEAGRSAGDVVYTRVNRRASSTLLNVQNSSDTGGGDPPSGTFPINSKVNVVARCLFRSPYSLGSDPDTGIYEFRRATILETKTINSSTGLITWLSLLKRNKINTNEQYAVGYVPSTGYGGPYEFLGEDYTSSLSSVTYHSNQPEGLLASVNELYSTSYPYLYFFCGNLLFSKTSTNQLLLRGGGARPSSEESWLSCNPVIDSCTRKYIVGRPTWVDRDVIYGVSAPTPPHYTQDNVPTQGKYYLFKYDTHFTLRVALADFKDMNVWEALGYLAQKANYIMGFIGEDFWFIPRDYDDTVQNEVDLTLYYTPTENEVDVFEIEEVGFGEEDIVNVCKISPSKATLGEPKLSFTYVPRGTFDTTGQLKKEYEPNVEITVNQRDTLQKTIKLSCVCGGFISQAPLWGTNQMVGTAVKFRYLITTKVWETTLYKSTTINEISSTGSIYVSDGAIRINPGDLLEIHLSIDKDTTYIGTYVVKYEAPYSDAMSGLVSVFGTGEWTSGISSTQVIPAGTKVIVRPLNKWSDYNINLLRNPDFEFWTDMNPDYAELETWTPYPSSSNAELETNNVFTGTKCVRLYTDAVFGSIKQVVAVEANTTYKFSVMCRGERGTVAIIPLSGTATFTIDTGYRGTLTNPVRNSNWEEIRGTLVVGTATSVTVYLRCREDQETPNPDYTWFDSALLVKGSHISREYFTVSYHDQFTEIGNSKVFLKFSDENQKNYEASDSQETKFMIGDNIEVTCPGMALEKDESSMQVVRDQSSVSRYGTQEESINNPFLTSIDAKELATAVVEAYKDPHMEISINTQVRPGLAIIDQSRRLPIRRIDVYSPSHFPNEPGHKFRGSIKSIKYGKNSITLIIRGNLIV